MKLKLSECTASQVRQMLSSDPVVPVEAQSIKKLSLTTKYGASLSEFIADAAVYKNAVIFLNLASDDIKSPINEYLATNRPDKMRAALDVLAKAADATNIICYTTPEIKFEYQGMKTLIGEHSLVLREESALYHISETGELRSCLLNKGFPSEGYQGLPTIVLDSETLCRIYEAAQPDYVPSKIVVIYSDEKAILTEVKINTPLGTLIDEIGVEVDKPTLVGGVLGKFEASEQLVKEKITTDALFDSVCVYGSKDCMADISKKIADEAKEESCGKCVLCREGTWQIQSIFQDICNGKAKREDLATITDIGSLIHIGAFCSFGKKMVGPAMTSVDINKAELESHFVKKTCPAGVCQAFAKYVIDPKLCTGCTDCIDECEEDAITGKKGFIHMIDKDLCEACGKCAKACEEGAIVLADGNMRLPRKLTKVGKFQ